MTPYRPKTFTFEDAAHLLRRAGFGGSIEEIEALQALGPEAAVERLLNFPSNETKDLEDKNPFDLEQLVRERGQLGPARRFLPAWWLYKLVTTVAPLREKLTLFWHGHFASGLEKVENPFDMQAQNELFRQHGAGKFFDLALAVAKDPAMLRYLDNFDNKKGHPNENFARELMELFTMGFGSGYSEKDVQEAARAFTGWTFLGSRQARTITGRFTFRQQDHDTGQKIVLGQRGNFDGTDIVRIVTDHPATARFMTKKLWRFFVSQELGQQTHDELVQIWTETKGDIAALLRTIFNSNEFYSPEHRQSLIKSPVEYVVGTLRGIKAQLEAGHYATLSVVLANLAQSLFYPPNVAGWDGDLDWIADSTILGRLTFIGMITSGRIPAAKVQDEDAPRAATLDFPLGADLGETISRICKTFLGSEPNAQLRHVLESFASANTPQAARNLAYLVLASPQYHLA